MNEKKAKQLRKIARGYTMGQPYVEYAAFSPPNYMQNNAWEGYRKITKGIPRKMLDTCTRYVYKQLKKIS